MSLPWTLFEGPVTVLGLGIVLTFCAIGLLWEYRRLFFADPRPAMTGEVLMQVIATSGGPGYLAAFLLAAAVLSFGSALIMAVTNVMSYVGA
jgi:hypothetical protein